MKKAKINLLALSFAVLLIFSLTGCKDNSADPTLLWENAAYTENTSFGEGEKTVQVEVKLENNSVTFTIKTDAEKLGDILLEHNIVEGEMAQYGLYIKSANGIGADYDKDGAYWSLSKNGEYLLTGADQTVIADGEHYELTYTKG